MGLFSFNEDVLTELYFHDTGTSIKQKVVGKNKEELIAQNAITFIVHYFSIVKNKEEKKVVKTNLINCFNNNFKSTKTKHYTYETNHINILYDIIHKLSDYEFKAATRFFGVYNNFFGVPNIGYLATCTERNLLIKLYEEDGDTIEAKPKFGKYTFKFKTRKNVPFCRLNIFAGKDKILLPLSTSIVANYAFLDLDKLKQNYKEACLDFLENYNQENISTFKKTELLSLIFEKHFK